MEDADEFPDVKVTLVNEEGESKLNFCEEQNDDESLDGGGEKAVRSWQAGGGW